MNVSGETISSVGGTLESFLEERGERGEIYSAALKRALAWQIEQARKAKGLSKSAMAARMGTSRSQLERVLDPANSAVSIDSLSRAAHSVGKKLNIEIVDE